MVVVWFNFFVEWNIKLHGLVNAKVICVEQSWHNLIHSWVGDKGFQIFPKDINLKVNIIVQLEFELAYHYVAVQHVNHFTVGTPSLVGVFQSKII